jgi:hypothetical protein
MAAYVLTKHVIYAAGCNKLVEMILGCDLPLLGDARQRLGHAAADVLRRTPISRTA